MATLHAYNNNSQTYDYMQCRINYDEGDKYTKHQWYINTNETGWRAVGELSLYFISYQLRPEDYVSDTGNKLRWRCDLYVNDKVADTLYSDFRPFRPLQLILETPINIVNDKQILNNSTTTIDFGDTVQYTELKPVAKSDDNNSAGIAQPLARPMTYTNVTWYINGNKVKTSDTLNPNDYQLIGKSNITVTADVYCPGWTTIKSVKSHPYIVMRNPLAINITPEFIKAAPEISEWTSPAEQYVFKWVHKTTETLKPGWKIAQTSARIWLSDSTHGDTPIAAWLDDTSEINIFDAYTKTTPIISMDLKVNLETTAVVVDETGQVISDTKTNTIVSPMATTKSSENLISRADFQLNPLIVNTGVETPINIQSDFIGTSRYRYFPEDMFTAGTYEWFWDGVINSTTTDSFSGLVPFEGADKKELKSKYTYVNDDLFTVPQVIETTPAVINKVVNPMPEIIVDFKRDNIVLEWGSPETDVVPTFTGMPAGAVVTKYEWFTTPDNIISTSDKYTVDTSTIKTYALTLKVDISADGYNDGVFYSRPLSIIIKKKALSNFNFTFDAPMTCTIRDIINVDLEITHDDPDVKISTETNVNTDPVFNTGKSFTIEARKLGTNTVTTKAKATSDLYEDAIISKSHTFEVTKKIFDIEAHIEAPDSVYTDDYIYPFVVFDTNVPATDIRYKWLLNGDVISMGEPAAGGLQLTNIGTYTLVCEISLKANDYEDDVLIVTKTISVLNDNDSECELGYIHDLNPGRDRGYVWMGWWVHDEIQDALIENFDWVSDPGNERFKYKCDLKTLAKAIQDFPDVEIQESRNGYILTKKDLT